MSNKKRVDLSTRVGADFFRSDKGAKVDVDLEKHYSNKKEQKEKTTFYITPELHKKLRVECAEQGKRISSFIEELLSNYFNNKKS